MVYYIKNNYNMPEIEDNSIDCVVTSPPYNQKKNYVDHDDNKSWEDYIEDLRKTNREVYRKMKDSGVYWFNIGDRMDNLFKSHDVVKESLLTEEFFLKQRLVWHKMNCIPSSQTYNFTQNYEFIYVLTKTKDPPSIDKYLVGKTPSDRMMGDTRHIIKIEERKRFYGKYTVDPKAVWPFFVAGKNDFTQTKDETLHSAEFPVELPYFCIRCSCFGEGHFKVLDPWLGTGTTLLAVRMIQTIPYTYEGIESNLKVEGIGYEMSEAYVPTIEKKLRAPIPELRIPEDSIRRSAEDALDW
jgi:site-specific DNA-methyltransferase (adenine-specific)